MTKTTRLARFLTSTALAALLAACAAPGAAPPPTGPAPVVTLALDCPTRADVPTAVYVGPYMGVENIIPAKEMAQDVYCADVAKARLFPKGFVTIYGSSRIRDGDPVYASVRNFANAWTTRYGSRYPIMTGAGPGLMDAGNRGAKEAGGPSVGYTTYYDRAATPDPLRPYGGDPKGALNQYVTSGFIFSSVAIREAAMIKHSAAMVVAPGGTGTEWELFQIVETIKSRQITKVPVYILGDRATHWATLDARLNDLAARRTINKEEVAFIKFVPNEQELLRQLAADMGLN